MIEYIDISKTIGKSMEVFPKDPSEELSNHTSYVMNRKQGINVSSISIASHTDTHIDAPAHLFEQGPRMGFFL